MPDPVVAENGTPLPAAQADAKEASGAVTFRNIAWPIGLSLLVMGLIGYFTFEPDSFWDMVAAFNPGLVAATGAIIVLRVIFGGWRLQYISHGRIGLLAGIKGQLAWDFFSYVTPSTIGGGPFAAVYISRNQQIPMGEATALLLFSMLIDQLWSAIAILSLFVAAVYWDVFPDTLGTIGTSTVILTFAIMMIWVGIFAYATLFRPELLTRASDRLFRLKWLRRFHGKVTYEMQQFRRFNQIKRKQPFRFYLNAFLLSVFSMMGRYWLPVLIIWSVYPAFDVWLGFLRSLAMNLGAMVLPTPGGAGGLEGLYMLFLGSMMGAVKPLIAPTMFTWRVLGYYISIVVGVFLTMHQVQKTVKRKEATPMANGEANGTVPATEAAPSSVLENTE